jgi:hypothetical protein
MEQGEIVIYKTLDSSEFQIEVIVEEVPSILGMADSISNG